MKETELIKEYLQSIEFSQYKAYIQLIENYVTFKEKHLHDKELEDSLFSIPKESKTPKVLKETRGCKK